MKKEKTNLLSVIDPAYKQNKTIKKDLLRIKGVLDKIRYDYELICVADGKEDSTYKNAKQTKGVCLFRDIEFYSILCPCNSINKIRVFVLRFDIF